MGFIVWLTNTKFPTLSAWASHKSFKRKDADPKTPPDDPGNPSVDFHGERRSNHTHQSTTDPEARLARKSAGKEAKLSYAEHVLMENRNGIAVQGCVTQATGRAEPQAAMAMVEKIPGWHRVTLGADKGYHRKELVQELRDHQVTPHLACKPSTIIDERTTRHPGYQITQRKRKRIEEIFGVALIDERSSESAIAKTTTELGNRLSPIQTMRLDDFAFRDGNPLPTFIKIDIEGHAGPALEGMKRILKVARPKIICELHRARCCAEPARSGLESSVRS